MPVDPEVRDHDPALALYGGSADGLALPLAMAAGAAGLLRPGGVLVMEHADVQGPALLRALAATGRWSEATDYPDLTGRPRVVVARRAGGVAGSSDPSDPSDPSPADRADRADRADLGFPT